MFSLRSAISIYRKFLNFIFGKNINAVMPEGLLCSISEFQFEINRGDIVHPCVRYCEKPFMGHKWWLVYTPYYNADASLENPILCYGDFENEEAPIKWNAKSLIRD